MAMSDVDRNNSILREMERTSMDQIRIYNPTDEDFYIVWDSHKFLVPNKNKSHMGQPKGHAIVFRYLAEWYKKHMTDKMINDKQDMKLAELKEKYDKAGVEDGVLKAHLDVERNRSLRTDNETEVARIADIIWLGLEQRFGMDDMIQDAGEKIDRLTVHEKVSEQLKNKVYKKPEAKEEAPQPQEKATVYPISNAKKKLMEEAQS